MSLRARRPEGPQQISPGQSEAVSAAERRRAALGSGYQDCLSPERAKQPTCFALSAFQGYEYSQTLTQGGGNARVTRIALPWADLLRPFRPAALHSSRTPFLTRLGDQQTWNY
jgi:hypothetical protein